MIRKLDVRLVDDITGLPPTKRCGSGWTGPTTKPTSTPTSPSSYARHFATPVLRGLATGRERLVPPHAAERRRGRRHNPTIRRRSANKGIEVANRGSHPCLIASSAKPRQA